MTTSLPKSTHGGSLALVRRTCKVKVEDLASKMNVKVGKVVQLENNPNPGFEDIKKYAHALGFEAKILLEPLTQPSCNPQSEPSSNSKSPASATPQAP